MRRLRVLLVISLRLLVVLSLGDSGSNFMDVYSMQDVWYVSCSALCSSGPRIEE